MLSHSFFQNRCPVCKSKAIREPGEAGWICTASLKCPAQALERLIHFASRDAFDIEGLGERNIETFFKEGLLKSPADIFRLEEKLAPSDLFSLTKEEKIASYRYKNVKDGDQFLPISYLKPLEDVKEYLLTALSMPSV